MAGPSFAGEIGVPLMAVMEMTIMGCCRIVMAACSDDGFSPNLGKTSRRWVALAVSDGRTGDTVRHRRDCGWKALLPRWSGPISRRTVSRGQLKGGSHGCNEGARLGKKMMFCSGALVVAVYQGFYSCGQCLGDLNR
ncbi:hypothetical protein ACLOJK_019195 [Asimina triloba]